MTPPVPGSRVRFAAKLGYASVEEFCARYGQNVTRGGIYLRVKEPRPVGTAIDVELRLSTGEAMLRATGAVSFTTGTQGQGVAGMGIRFDSVDAAGQAVLERACAGRVAAESSLPPLPAGVGPALGEHARPPTAPQAPGAQPPSSPPPPAPEARAPPQLSTERGPAVSIESPLDRAAKPSERPTGPIIGIDLGTTYSCAAYVKNGRPYIIPSREGYNTVPSIIALSARNKFIIGHPAKGQMLTNPNLTVYGAKRLLGRPFHSPVVREIKDRFHYQIVEGQKGESAVQLGPRTFSLQELSAMILYEVKEIAQSHLSTVVERAIITCPAYYNDHQRQAVREAGALAGLHVERILNEPTAAALAFGYGRNLKQRILIYDLGGGTFDASVLELHDNVYEVISTGGDTFLGGVDFDMQLVDHLLADFQKKTGRAFKGDRVALQRIIDAAERAKIALSERESTAVRVPFVTTHDGKPQDLDCVVTRAQLSSLSEALVKRSLTVCDQVLREKKLLAKDLDEIILVGGMSRMPLVAKLVEEYFGKPPHKGVHPDEAVALGAALLGHSLEQLTGVVLIDVLPMSIGIGLPGGRVKKVVERNTPLPHSKTYRVSTTRDAQRELELTIFQGEGDRTDQNEYLGTLMLGGLPAKPRGEVKIEIGFALSPEGLLTVTATELATGKEVTTTLSTRDTPEAVREKLGGDSMSAATALTGETQAVPVADTVAQPAKGPPPEKTKGAPAARARSGARPTIEILAAQYRSAERPPAEQGGILGFFRRLFGGKS